MGRKKNGLSWTEKISYGMGDCGANVTVALCSTFLTAYYTDTVGIAAAAVGTMMLLARVFDGITDIVMGLLLTGRRHAGEKPGHGFFGRHRLWRSH